MQTRAITADDFITEVQFLQSRATHYWRKAVEKLEKLERFAFQLIFILSVHCSLWRLLTQPQNQLVRQKVCSSLRGEGLVWLIGALVCLFNQSINQTLL